MKIKTILLMAIAALTISIVFTACGKTNVDIDSMLTVSFTGSDGFGKPVFNTDISALEDLAEEKDDETQLKYFVFLASLNTTADKENLKNGDEITVTTTYNKEIADELGLNVINTETKVTVQGLEELKELKLSDIISIEYSGISPKANAIVDIKDDLSNLDISLTSEHPSVNTHEYGKYATSELKNGDTFTVKVQTDAEELAALGYVMSETEYTVTVEGLDELVTDVSQLSAENIEALRDEMLKFAQDKVNGYVVDKYSSTQIYSYYGTGAIEATTAFNGSRLSSPCVMGVNNISLSGINAIGFDTGKIENANDNVLFCAVDVEMVVSEYKLKDLELSGVMVFWLSNIKLDNEGNVTYSKIGLENSFKTAEDVMPFLRAEYSEKYLISEIK